MNLYQYVRNNPVNASDYTGLYVACTCTAFGCHGTTTCHVVKSSAQCDVTAPGLSCFSMPIPGGGPHPILQGGDPSCPNLNAAITIINSITNAGGKCQQWLDEHGAVCGPINVSVHGNWKLACILGQPMWSWGSLGIGVCQFACTKSPTELASLLIHEYAHFYCTIGFDREDCAVSAQEACADEIIYSQ